MDNQLLFTELCTKILANEASLAERRQFETLLEDESNKREFEQLELIWNNVPQFEGIQVNTSAAWDKISPKISVEQPQQIKVVKRSFPVMRIAAAVTLLVLSGIVVYYFGKPKAPEFVKFLPGNKVEQVTLKDGSSIRAGKNSSIEYAANFTTNRLVKLKGSAFFTVSKDSLHPFVVESENIKVTVLGTAFSIENLEDKSTRVFVEHGKVSVWSNAQNQVLLTNGMSVKINSKGEIVATNSDEVDYELTGVRKFNNTPLSEAVQFLEKQFKAKIEIGEGVNKNHLISLPVNCNTQKLDEIIDVIAITADLQLEKRGDTYILTLP